MRSTIRCLFLVTGLVTSFAPAGQAQTALAVGFTLTSRKTDIPPALWTPRGASVVET